MSGVKERTHTRPAEYFQYNRLVDMLSDNSVNLPGIKTSPVSSTALPLAAVSGIFFRLDMKVVDVVHQVLQRVEQQVALQDSGLNSADATDDELSEPNL